MTQNVLWSRASVCMCVCLSVCLSVRSRMPTLLHGPGCNLAEWYGLPPSCALLDGFAIGVRVALLWQHNANPSYKLASIPWYDNIVRTAGGVCAHCWPVTGRWRGRSQNCAPYMGTGRGWLAVDWRHSRHYCGGLDCGLPMVAFWRHNANAKC